jgi:hypothetical protein
MDIHESSIAQAPLEVIPFPFALLNWGALASPNTYEYVTARIGQMHAVHDSLQFG